MRTLILCLCLLSLCLPAFPQAQNDAPGTMEINTDNIYCQQIVIGDPQGVHCTLSPNGALFTRDDGNNWAELTMENSTGNPQIRLLSEFRPQRVVCIAANDPMPVVTYVYGERSYTLLWVAVDAVTTAPVTTPRILSQPWQ
jgi:hypothetical protein